MLFKPFGPEIYKTTLTEESRDKLEKIALENADKKEKRFNIGFIEKEINIYEDIKNDVLKELHKIVIDYLNVSTGFISSFRPINQRDIHCTATWANIQKPAEFFPMHNHPTSDIVCVTFPKVEVQDKVFLINNNMKTGSLIFSYGDGSNFFENTSHVVKPVTGDVYVFPASLRHGTIPICDGDLRISTSTNFSFSEYFRMRMNMGFARY
jgi:hypothetical protein